MDFWKVQRRILIIEDREDEYRDIRSLLGAIEGSNVLSVRAFNAEEAEARLASEFFDIIIASHSEGKSLIPRKDLDHYYLPPLILIVENAEIRKALRGKEANVSDILIKENLNFDLLDKSIRVLLLNKKNEESMNLLRMGIERSNDIFLITEANPIDAPGPKIVYVNEAFERLTGYKREEVIGKTPRILQGPKTDRAILATIRDSISKGQPCFAEVINYDKDGKEYWIEMDIFPITNEKGVTTHLMGIERDTTERKNTEERLRHSQKMEAIGQLAGGMAHDFNNLLNVILANLDLLELKLKDSEDLLKRVRSAQDAIQRGADVNKRLLAFSRKQALNPEPCDVNQILRDFRPILDQIRTEKIEIEYEFSDEKLVCDIEKSGLENAVLNLALNARDSMPNGGKIYISSGFLRNGEETGSRISGLEPVDYSLITVTDTGTGMDDATKARIFDPFFSTKGGGKGTGLGLTMVYGFVKQSNGFLKVITVPDYGSSFLIFLPLLKNSSEEISLSIDHKNSSVRKKALVIEENRETAELVGVYLRELGFEPLLTSDIKRLTHFFSGDSNISFVLLDLQLAKSKGVDIKTELGRFGAQRVILTSSNDPKEFEISNGFPFIRKPYTKMALKEAVRKIGEDLA
ncbi:PAS domain S-box protein [Leptospira semungkisensis]|uniref:histidine kinase n=1 Tax=Leptospira semungkisensis TaxID=2484985 RepID=A0A4R9FS95_9LEPT|nr:PAS domain S-box protein [Leptospira semungkisensis]TGK01712.1 PAS domain S-box protein [Leptospira semungkisensis]